MAKAVIAWCMYKDEWALMLAAQREADGTRAIWPTVYALSHSPLFAGFSGGGPLFDFVPSRDVKDKNYLLQTLVEQRVQSLKVDADILEVVQVTRTKKIAGVIYKMLNGIPFDKSIHIMPEPALEWIRYSKQGADVYSTEQQVRLSAHEHGLDRLSHDERADIHMQQLIGKGKVTKCS